MVTTVGTASDLPTLITNMLYLEQDAIAAYDATIDRLESPDFRRKVEEFKSDHLRHVQELERLASEHSAEVPREGDSKELLTTGKVALAGLVGGDGAVLRAMSTNESDTVSAYHSAVENGVVPESARRVFESGLADERRHKRWMEETAAGV